MPPTEILCTTMTIDKLPSLFYWDIQILKCESLLNAHFYIIMGTFFSPDPKVFKSHRLHTGQYTYILICNMEFQVQSKLYNL